MSQVSDVTCWRCGVVFDGADYIPGAPCPDCQLDDPNEYRKFNIVKVAEADRLEYLIRQLHSERYSDREIGAALGMSMEKARRARVKIGLKAHEFTGTEKWGDHDAVLERMREASRAYWSDPNRKPRRTGHGPAVEGRLATPEAIREERRQFYDSNVSGKQQTYAGHRSVSYNDQRRKND